MAPLIDTLLGHIFPAHAHLTDRLSSANQAFGSAIAEPFHVIDRYKLDKRRWRPGQSLYRRG